MHPYATWSVTQFDVPRGVNPSPPTKLVSSEKGLTQRCFPTSSRRSSYLPWCSKGMLFWGGGKRQPFVTIPLPNIIQTKTLTGTALNLEWCLFQMLHSHEEGLATNTIWKVLFILNLQLKKVHLHCQHWPLIQKNIFLWSYTDYLVEYFNHFVTEETPHLSLTLRYKLNLEPSSYDYKQIQRQLQKSVTSLQFQPFYNPTAYSSQHICTSPPTSHLEVLISEVQRAHPTSKCESEDSHISKRTSLIRIYS